MKPATFTDVAPRCRRSAGFSLIEVLVSLVVLSLGLLGIASLLGTSLSGSHTSSVRTQAIVLASDIASRMRANRPTAVAPAPDNYEGIAPTDNRCRAVHFNHRHGAPTVCTPQQMAADDLFDWLAQLAAVLPQGAGVVCLDSTPDDGVAGTPACDGVGVSFAVKVFWTEKPPRNAIPEPKRFSTIVRP